MNFPVSTQSLLGQNMKADRKVDTPRSETRARSSSRKLTSGKKEGETYLGVHLLGSESADVPDGTGGSLLELDALESLVEVKRVVAAGRLQFRLFSHLN